ncbi:hypothetical protein F5890DRAFT_1558166 [Lentinula detonsa]|uniref:Uncharacterized protein n=1 Tax=Lentinula detonsa TaxID=2804962 RepID=A0AA38UMJ6_9AGAR|nr:hypothetical protein F5890DRAFT_1558166 [Lentinula detonsa]
MLFAYSGNDILLSEKDYVSLFVDGNLEDAPSTTESLNAHPKKRFQFTPVEDSSNAPPSAVGDSDSVRIFRLVKINPDGNGHSEKLVYCQEYSEAIESEPIITAGAGAVMQESYRQEEAVSLNNIFESVSAGQPSSMGMMSEQAQFDLTWMNFYTSSIAPEVGLDLTTMDLDTFFAPEVEPMGCNTDFDLDKQGQWMTSPGSLSSFASVSALEATDSRFDANNYPRS